MLIVLSRIREVPTMLLKGFDDNMIGKDCNLDELQIYGGNHDSTCEDEVAEGNTHNLTLGGGTTNSTLPITDTDVMNPILPCGDVPTGEESELNCVQNINICGAESDCDVISAIQKQQENQMDYKTFSNQELLLNIHLLKGCEKLEHTAIRSEITPPPGAPKLENSARLRRYRHNVD